MQRLNIVDVYGRGLADFTSLTPLERDVFVVHDLNLYYEMEGGFEDYILGGAHTEQLAWLSDTLLRVKNADSAVVLRELMALSEDKRDLMAPLCDRFYDLMESRWAAGRSVSASARGSSSVVTRLRPNNSFKPNPLRGSA